MAAEGQSDKVASDMEVQMKQRMELNSSISKKIMPFDVYQCLENVYRVQQVDVAQWGSGLCVVGMKEWVTSACAECYKCGMHALAHCWWKCIAYGSDYIEK